MSAFRSQQLPCRRIASFGRYTLTGFDPGRRVPPLSPALTSPSSIPRAPLSRLTLTDGRMVRAAWHTSMAHYRSVVALGSRAVWCCGAVRCTDLGAFLLKGPAIYLISAHSEPTCVHSISGPRASTPVWSPVAPAAIVLPSIVF